MTEGEDLWRGRYRLSCYGSHEDSLMVPEIPKFDLFPLQNPTNAVFDRIYGFNRKTAGEDPWPGG